MSSPTPGQARLVLRGVNTGGVSSTVAVYVDETPFGSSTGLVNGAVLAGDFDTFDLSRIEVLRGPAGHPLRRKLAGRRSQVRDEHAAARPVRGARARRAGVRRRWRHRLQCNGVVNVPLGDIAAFRASGFYRKNAGWIDANGADANFLGIPTLEGKDINESEVWGGRGSVLFKPTTELTIRLTAIAQQIES